MTTDNDVKEAERNLIIKLLTALGDKRVLGAFVTMILALCAYIAYWASSHTTMTLSATEADPCCAVQKAAQSKAAAPTNALAKVAWFGCAMSACQPMPQPKPAPTPTGAIDAGPPPAASVVFPQCNPPTLKSADPKKLDEYRKTLRPRVKVTAPAMMLNLESVTPASVFWHSNIPFCGNQKNLGACEAFTQLDIVTAKPRTVTFSTQDLFNAAAVNAYKWITANDSFPGAYPPDDTGSDSLTGCKWLVQNGYAKSCVVLSGKAAVLSAIQVGPVISGMNWLDGMMTPDRCGNMSLTGPVLGGHAEGIFGYDVVLDEWHFDNHWDQDWGTCDPTNGHCGYHKLTSTQLFSTTLDADFVQPVL